MTAIYEASIFLCGGLGNQCFEIAALLSFAIKTKRNILLCYESAGSRRSSYWDSVFSALFVDYDLKADLPEIKMCRRDDFEQQTKTFLLMEEQSFSFTPLPIIKQEVNVLLRGYFQSSLYFADIEPILIRMFQLQTTQRAELDHLWSTMVTQRPKDECVSIHVRRGDYLALQHIYVILSQDYYTAALEYFPSSATFVVFSDDVQWCRSVWGERSNFIFVSDTFKDYQAFHFMAYYCQGGHIIANSTFSWWGAYVDWLNTGKKRIVVAPEVWFNGSGPKTNSLTVPGWVIIGEKTKSVRQFDVGFLYGGSDKQVDVTEIATSLFIRNEIIAIDASISFNDVFGDVAPGVYKHLNITNHRNGRVTRLPEIRQNDFIEEIATKTLISLGGGCDVKTHLIQNNGIQQPTQFFDYLWNLDGGLKNVTEMIANDFEGFDSMESTFETCAHPRWNQETSKCVTTKCVFKNYKDIAVIHGSLSEESLASFQRKKTRFLNLLRQPLPEPIIFIYYRQYNEPCNASYQATTAEKLKFYLHETNDFCVCMSRKYPSLNFRLFSLFMEPWERKIGVTDVIDQFFMEHERFEKSRHEKAILRRVYERGPPEAQQRWNEIYREIKTRQV